MNFNVWSSTQHPVNNNNNNNDKSENGCLCSCCCCWRCCFNPGGAQWKSPELRQPQPQTLNAILETESPTCFLLRCLFPTFFVPIPTSFPLSPTSILDYIRFIEPRSSTSLTPVFINFFFFEDSGSPGSTVISPLISQRKLQGLYQYKKTPLVGEVDQERL